MQKHLYTEDGRIRSFVNIYVNDEDIRYLEKENTPIKDGDTISIVPSIAGGSRKRRRRRWARSLRRGFMAIQTSTLAAEAARTLSKEEIQRYSRHLIMPEVGMDGQLKLARAKVLMIGAGGLGAPLGLYLAAAGVGRLGIVDFDTVDAHEPAAANHVYDPGRGPAEGRGRARAALGDEPARFGSTPTGRCSPARTRSICFATRTSSSTARTTSRRATW